MSSNIKVQRICQYCGVEFTARTTTTLYCSHRCNSRAYKAKQRDKKVEQSNLQVQKIKAEPIEELKAKAFLSINEACTLVGISRRTLYRMIGRGDLVRGKAGARTIIRRADLEFLLFETPADPATAYDSEPSNDNFDTTGYISLGELQKKYSISASTLSQMIKRHEIPKFKKGRIVFASHEVIHRLLS